MPIRYTTLFFILLCLFSAFLFWKPAYNGDTGFYIAVASQQSGESDTSAVKRADEEMWKSLPRESYLTNKEILQKQVPGLLDYYRIKPLYVASIKWVHWLGVSWTKASYLPSILAFVVMMLITHHWLKQLMAVRYATALALLLMVCYPVMASARMSSPDALSGMVFLMIFYQLYWYRSGWLIIGLLFLLISIRLDNILMAVILLGGLLYQYRNERPKISIGWLIGSGLALALFTITLNYWCTEDFFWYDKINRILYKESYLWQLGKAFRFFSSSYGMLFLLIFIVLHFFVHFRFTRKQHLLLVLLGAMIFFRLILFPSYEERFFGPYYIVAMMVLVSLFQIRKFGRR